jgi:hypothetical protein
VLRRIASWTGGFGRFWYRYIFGDDWTIAAAVGIGLIVSAVLNRNGLIAWWLIPVVVVVMLGVSLRRASRAGRSRI